MNQTRFPAQITAILPAETLDKMATEYKARKLASKRTDRRPSLRDLADDLKISRDKIERLIGQLGSKDELHEFLGRPVDLEVSLVNSVFEKALLELEAKIPKMTPKDLIETVKALNAFQQAPTTQAPALTINAGPTLNLDQYLAKRLPKAGPVVEVEPAEE